MVEFCRVERETNEYHCELENSSIDLRDELTDMFCNVETELEQYEVELEDKINVLIELLSEKLAEDVIFGNGRYLNKKIENLRVKVAKVISEKTASSKQESNLDKAMNLTFENVLAIKLLVMYDRQIKHSDFVKILKGK